MLYRAKWAASEDDKVRNNACGSVLVEKLYKRELYGRSSSGQNPVDMKFVDSG